MVLSFVDRSGSIIVSFVILFKSPVTLSDGLAPLTAAVESGTLGPYTVKDLRAIEDVSPTTIPSDSPTSAGSTTAPVKPVDKTTSSREGKPLIYGSLIDWPVTNKLLEAILTPGMSINIGQRTIDR